MKKFMTKVVGICLGLTMAVGVGFTVASNKEAIPVRATDGSLAFSSGSYANGEITWTSSGVLTVVQEKNGASSDVNSSYVSAPRWYAGHKITFSPASGVTITQMSFTATSNAYATDLANSTWSIGSASASSSSVTWTGNANSDFTVVLGKQSRLSTGISLVYSTSGGDPISYTGVTVSEKAPLTGTYKGDAYYECQATVTGTGDFSSLVTWSLTSTNAYGTGTSIANTASVDTNGKITFLDNCTVYAWATAADGTTHNSSGFSITATDLKDNPINEWTKVSSTSNVSSSKVYALSNDKTNFAANSVSSSQLALTTSLSSIGYFVLEEVTGGYHLSFATCTSDVWSSSSSYVNNSSSTSLSGSGTVSSVWTVDSYSGGVILRNSSNSNRFLGLTGVGGIKAYASGNESTYPPVYLYEAGSLPIIECAEIELTGKPSGDMSIGDKATLGYSALDSNANEWVGDVTYSISNESVSGVVELSATTGVSVTLTAKKAGTARVSVQDTAGNADPDYVDVTVLADPERTELPIGSYNVEIDYSGVAKDDTVPASKEYEIKAKEGTGAGRVWYKNMTIAYSNVTASYANQYTFSKNGSASSATVTTTSESAKVTQVVISYYNANRLTMTDASDNEIDVASSSSNICTYALNSESFTLSSTSTATSIYYIHITFAVVDESEEFLSLVINKGSTATSFTEGDAPNHEGLTVHENYSTDGETISRFEDVTDSVTWNYSIETIAANTTSYTVTATYGGHTSAAVTIDGFTVTALAKYTHVTSQSELFDGEVVILSVVGTNNKTALAYDSSKLTTQDANFLGEKIASNNEMEFTVRMYGNQFALEHGEGSFLNYSGSSNAVYLGSKTLSSTTPECGWTLDSTGLHSEAGSRYLKYNSSSPRFACYGDNTYQVVQLYKADTSTMSTQNKADTFLYRELHLRDISTSDNTEGTACKGNSGYYAIAKAAFTAESFVDAKSTVLGNADAVARLTAWAAANGETFDSSNGTFTQVSARILPTIIDGNNRSAVSIIVIISMVSLTAIGGYFFLKKRKETH